MTSNNFLMLSCALVLTVAAGCSSVPTKDIKIHTEAAPTADFSRYRSYAWLGAATLLADAGGKWEAPDFDADAEIKYLIDRELRARGMTENSREPDLMVAFALGVNMDALEIRTDPETDLEVLTNVPQGGVLIALMDTRTGFTIWAGKAMAKLRAEKDAEVARARLDYAVTKMLSELPDA